VPHTLPVVEFYITNVCNLACEHCNRFNNHVFRGWQSWQDYAQDYAAWSDLLSFDKITILGGEPLLNPTILEWCTGIRSLWPQSIIHLVSNGYHINRVAGLRDTLRKNKILLCVTAHNLQDQQWLRDQIDQFLGGSRQKHHAGPADNLHFVSSALPTGVWFQPGHSFVDSSLHTDANGNLTLHQSNPLLAHENCSFVQNKTYHLIKGKLYKCGPVALLPEFDQQYPLAISQQDRDSLNAYRPYTAEDFAQRGQQILDEIKQPIPQCGFCPEKYKVHQIQAHQKGKSKTINIIKRSQGHGRNHTGNTQTTAD
jgi:hypothetical protein